LIFLFTLFGRKFETLLGESRLLTSDTIYENKFNSKKKYSASCRWNFYFIIIIGKNIYEYKLWHIKIEAWMRHGKLLSRKWERELRMNTKGGGKFNVMENFCLLFVFFLSFIAVCCIFEDVCGLIMNILLSKV